MKSKIKTAGGGNPHAAFARNLQANFIAESVKWQAEGARLIQKLGIELCDADLLYSEIQTLANAPVALRNWCRVIQKHLDNVGGT